MLFQFQLAIDCKELKLPVTTTTLIILMSMPDKLREEWWRVQRWWRRRICLFYGFLSAMCIPQPARSEVFELSVQILTNWSYIFFKCKEKTGATNADAVWRKNYKRVRSMTGFRIDQGGIFGMCTGAAAKTEGSTSVFVNILKEQKPGKSGKRSCQQSSVNDRAGWSLNDKRRALNFRHRNLCLMFKGIWLHAWRRQITGVLTTAPVHKRSASFWIFCNGFQRLGDAKK